MTVWSNKWAYCSFVTSSAIAGISLTCTIQDRADRMWLHKSEGNMCFEPQGDIARSVLQEWSRDRWFFLCTSSPFRSALSESWAGGQTVEDAYMSGVPNWYCRDLFTCKVLSLHVKHVSISKFMRHWHGVDMGGTLSINTAVGHSIIYASMIKLTCDSRS